LEWWINTNFGGNILSPILRLKRIILTKYQPFYVVYFSTICIYLKGAERWVKYHYISPPFLGLTNYTNLWTLIINIGFILYSYVKQINYTQWTELKISSDSLLCLLLSSSTVSVQNLLFTTYLQLFCIYEILKTCYVSTIFSNFTVLFVRPYFLHSF
jgi:hypothetical protein